MSKNYIVTGATSEIGRSILGRLESVSGAKVIATGNESPLRGVRDGWLALEGVNLRVQDDLDRLRDAAESYFEEPFTLIHSVGRFWTHCPIHKFRVEDAEEMMGSHYLTLYGVASVMLPIAARLGGARLVAFSCNSVQFNYPEMAAFTSAKAAVECLVKCIANEWAKYGVSANALALPTIGTGQVEGLIRGGLKAGRLGEYLEPSAVADAVVDCIARMPDELNGNAIKLFSYSSGFYGQAFFERNPSPVEGDYLR